MEDISARIVERENALAKFDHARDDFVSAYAQIPDEALDWVPEGEDYSFAGLLVHVARNIENYSELLDLMRRGDFGEVRMAHLLGSYEADEVPAVTAADATAYIVRHANRVKQDRQGYLDRLEAMHDRLAGQLRDLAYDEYSRPAPVYFPEASEAYNVHASDVVRWLTDHYYEHVEQITKMLEQKGASTS